MNFRFRSSYLSILFASLGYGMFLWDSFEHKKFKEELGSLAEHVSIERLHPWGIEVLMLLALLSFVFSLIALIKKKDQLGYIGMLGFLVLVYSIFIEI